MEQDRMHRYQGRNSSGRSSSKATPHGRDNQSNGNVITTAQIKRERDSRFSSEYTPLTLSSDGSTNEDPQSIDSSFYYFESDSQSTLRFDNRQKSRHRNGHHSDLYEDPLHHSATSKELPRTSSEIIVTNCSSTIFLSMAALLVCLGALLFDAASTWSQQHQQSNSNSQYPILPSAAALFDNSGRYVLHDYDAQTPFSNFLPGLAGIYGKPIYAFYVNRGQAMASFGFESKDYPILEFQSANHAYQQSPFLGFRTFIQGTRKGTPSFLIEPYNPMNTNHRNDNGNNNKMFKSEYNNNGPLPKRTMYIGENQLQLQELDEVHGLETNVTYFVLPEEDFGALVRRTTITNTHKRQSVTISVLDGLAQIQPAGGKLNQYLKTQSNTMESYKGVYFPYRDSITMPFYRMTTEPGDTARVTQQQRGHYCMSFLEENWNGIVSDTLLPIIYDTNAVFGEDTTLMRPLHLYSNSIGEIVRGPQYGQAKTSSCFAAVESITLKPGETTTISTFYGAASSIWDVPVYARRIVQEGFVEYKLSRSKEVIRQITSTVATRTSHKLFDAHVEQMFLDNSLRGGIPIVLGDQDDNNGILNADEDPALKVFHVFSRIHGDLEQDSNDFMLIPSFFSQGPGNFRDMVQNRREDVVFNPRIGSFNVKMFLSLIQADGFEPLSVEAVAFSIPNEATCDSIAEIAVGGADGHRAQREALSGILKGGPFRPGQLFGLMEEQNIETVISKQELIDMVATASESTPMAVFEAGFWADHWTYYMDMIKSYLSIFPEMEEKVMYDTVLPYFFSPAFVQPRCKKYVLTLDIDGYNYHVQQLDAVVEDAEKRQYMDKLRSNTTGWYKLEAHWQADSNGVPFKSSAAAKLLLLATLKFASRDAYGMGIEYEGGRPGWDDANNGIAGMLGSGMPETFELKVLLEYLIDISERYHRDVALPLEVVELMDTINTELAELDGFKGPSVLNQTVPSELFKYWNSVATARENYREKVKIAFSGKTISKSAKEVAAMLKHWLANLDEGIARAMTFGTESAMGNGTTALAPTYFAYDVTKHDKTGQLNVNGHPFVIAKELKVRGFPLFLEGATRRMKTVGRAEAKLVYDQLRQSRLYDQEMSMFTISASLAGQPIDLGRTMAFPPGWLENQGVSLHMSYKFYLQVLKSGLFEEFFTEVLSGGMLPFMDIQRYGRSLMECSSFLVSSVFEDPSKHGRGYMARMSGSTVEFLSIWRIMFIGKRPFFQDEIDGKIRMQLLPTLPAWLFTVRDSSETDSLTQQPIHQYPNTPSISFKLFSSIQVHYYNQNQTNLFGVSPSSYRIGLRDGRVFDVKGPVIGWELADKIRRVVFVDFIEAHF